MDTWLRKLFNFAALVHNTLVFVIIALFIPVIMIFLPWQYNIHALIIIASLHIMISMLV